MLAPWSSRRREPERRAPPPYGVLPREPQRSGRVAKCLGQEPGLALRIPDLAARLGRRLQRQPHLAAPHLARHTGDALRVRAVQPVGDAQHARQDSNLASVTAIEPAEVLMALAG